MHVQLQGRWRAGGCCIFQLLPSHASSHARDATHALCLPRARAQNTCWLPFTDKRAQAEFKNCEFVENSAQGGAGAVSLQDGAIGLFSKTVFRSNSAGG